MSAERTFFLPESLRLTITGDALALEHDGDVVLEQTFGRRATRVDVRGDVTLRGLAKEAGVVVAGGTLRVEGDLDVDELRADVIEIGAVTLRARSIVASRRVDVAAGRVTADAIVAPEVNIAPAATGRVRLVDSLNERPPTKVRGCLSLEDYEADFGDVADFLARRGLIPVSPLPAPSGADEDAEDTAQVEVPRFATTTPPAEPPPPVVEAAPPALEADPPDVDEGAEPTEAPPVLATTDDEDSADLVFSEVVVTTDVDDEEEEDGDEPSEVAAAAEDDDHGVAEVVVTTMVDDGETDAPIVHDDVEELDDDAFVEMIAHDDEPARPARPDRRAVQVERAWERIRAAYPDAPPVAVALLGELAEGGRASEAVDRVDELWVATLREHLERRAPPPRAVTLAFHHLRAARG